MVGAHRFRGFRCCFCVGLAALASSSDWTMEGVNKQQSIDLKICLTMTVTTDPSRHPERIRQRTGDTMYQITWDNEGNPNLHQAVNYGSRSNRSSQHHIQNNEQILMLDQPPQQLSFQDISPTWSYTIVLYSALGLWFLYLLLPRGFRKQYCLAQRKRYAKRKDPDMPAAGYWLPVTQQADQQQPGGGRGGMMTGREPTATADRSPPPVFDDPPLLRSGASVGGGSLPPPSSSGPAPAPRTPNNNMRRKVARPPSPDHPAVKKIPPNRIIAETMGRLQGRGIRLVAHGVHCDPKRVWIRLDDDTQSVSWQTEFPRRVPDQSGQVSIVLMRGSMHRIALCNVLYIDVGKKTNALQRMDDVKVPEVCCLSLLTQNGSLDLQANSKLERDALVSCFSMILDDVHDEDWRALYEASPETSLVGAQGTEVMYQNPSDLQVEI